VSDARSTLPEIETLTGPFYASPDQLGAFEPVEPGDMPAAYRELLAHNDHMTVAVERHHGCQVDVGVLARQVTGEHYTRKIVLTRQTDGMVVQFGIMRIDFSYVPAAVHEAIESQSAPLGRILIEHNVLRKLELATLWRVTPGRELGDLLKMKAGDVTYGRTARIHVDGQPAIELLEILAPVE